MSNNGSNQWGVGYSSKVFFEQVLSNHSKVTAFSRSNDIQFEITRRSPLSRVNAVLVDVYMFGEAALYGVLGEFSGVSAVVNNGSWNHIAFDWREIAQRTGVVALSISDFLGALNVDQLTAYIPGTEREERDRRRRKSS